MKYIINTFSGLSIYHFFVCSIASFVQWENMFLNLNTWIVQGRFFYSLGFLLVTASCLAITHDMKGVTNEQT